MKLYLMRHCLADEGPRDDSDRPLDDVGKYQAKVMRKFMKLAEVHPDLIIASPFNRTRETAEIVQRGDTPLKFSAALEPDSTPEKAFKAVRKITDDVLQKQDDDGQPSVLVVTHGPLIQKMLAAVAFPFDDRWHWEHGSIAYVNTGESRFRWFVTPKLAAHLLGKDPADVENPVGEADLATAFGAGLVILSEHLLKVERAAIVDPLIARYRRLLELRWKRQLRRVVKAIKAQAAASPTLQADDLKVFTLSAIAGHDAVFDQAARRVRLKAYQAGAADAAGQLARAREAKRDDILPIPPDLPGPPGSDAGIMAGVDVTSGLRVGTVIDQAIAENLDLAALLAAVKGEFVKWVNPPADQVPRSETIALDQVSTAYHGGSADFVTDWRGGNGPVEKAWDVQPDACEYCLGNADEGWIDSEAPFTSGDFEPPLHPNCRCSISYRVAAGMGV